MIEATAANTEARAPALASHLPLEAEVVERIQESPTIFTLRLSITDPVQRAAYSFAPGQFNMLYLHGVGEVPISIVSDPEDDTLLDHTIRRVGRTTLGLDALRVGDRIGIRGPFGRGWPMLGAEGRNVVLVTGGLGCAPVMSVINYVMRRRELFGHLSILQGVKHCDDLIWHEQYQAWRAMPDVDVYLAADAAHGRWPYDVGPITVLFEQAGLTRESADPGCMSNSIAMMCGPERMMIACAGQLLDAGLDPCNLYLSMERNMHCGLGHCGHCQFGPHFICRDGPVFAYPEIADLLGRPGF